MVHVATEQKIIDKDWAGCSCPTKSPGWIAVWRWRVQKRHLWNKRDKCFKTYARKTSTNNSRVWNAKSRAIFDAANPKDSEAKVISKLVRPLGYRHDSRTGDSAW